MARGLGGRTWATPDLRGVLGGLGLVLGCGPSNAAVDSDSLTLAVTTADALELLSEDGSSRRSLPMGNYLQPPIWLAGGATLAFSGPGDDILVHDVDGDETFPATSDPRPLFELAANPTGDRLVVTHGDAESPGVAVIDLESGELHEVSPSGSRDRRPRWSPRGNEILFHRVFGSWIEEPTMVMVAGVGSRRPGAVARLTDRPEQEIQSESAWWSHDGAWLLLAEGHPRYTGRVVATSDERQFVVIDAEPISFLAMSPFGNRMFVAVDTQDASATFSWRHSVHDLDAESDTVFSTDHRAGLWTSAAWSPRRFEIAHSMGERESDVLRLLDLESGTAATLATFDEHILALDFSPDGNRIALAIHRFDSVWSGIVIVDRETGHVERIEERDADQFIGVRWRPAP